MLLVLSEKNNRPSLRISTVLMKSTPLMKGINVTGFYGSLLRVNGVAIDEECAGATKRYGDKTNIGAATAHVAVEAPSWIYLGRRSRRRLTAPLLQSPPKEPYSRNEPSFLCSSGNVVRNGKSDFERRGFTDGYDPDYISVQRIEREHALWEDS